ncbi:phosphonate ABC transporter substrate-binding protein [Xanthobacter dioxanivorans]|uniref:Phosphonate ABC transporter substrate-binding protein n=1 Tax=Xanthobacter dioxanivorans TaxID=2528964 RepID=A0A974PPR9_9HYPH|nr:phosphonate ABC transporter substrate-binding protein [Xanthobacter dioxanivorans]QRG07514.1 phosphonate ABC transporter substrate-binding protein [Xanthobacter dioxanivorans]
MLNRRTLIAAAAALAVSAGGAAAQDWKAKYPELTFAIIPAENASGVTERFAPLMDYLSKQLGTKVTLRIANDYAAVIEGQRAGNIHIASYGPSSFARALMTGAKIEAFAIEVNADGTKGYHSVLYVKADSPYKSIEDLKGKNLCLVDPNSTSGNNVPRFSMNKMGIKPDEYFGKVVYAGSHENAVIAVQQGTCDAAFNWWNDAQESALKRMERKGMAKYDDYRIVFKSDQIVNSPYAYLADLPADLKAKIRDAFFSIEKNDKTAFDKIYEGKSQLWQPVDNESYVGIIELNKFVDELRKKKS